MGLDRAPHSSFLHQYGSRELLSEGRYGCEVRGRRCVDWVRALFNPWWGVVAFGGRGGLVVILAAAGERLREGAGKGGRRE
jgi:hypothetical protein